MRSAMALFLLMSMAGVQAADEGYPRGDLLLEPEVLANGQVEGPLVVLDVRAAKDYEQGHIPGAQNVDPAAWAKAFGDGDDAAGWSRRIGELGIERGTMVVAYDDAKSKDAARIWWILRYWGVEDVRLVNGGWGAWKAGGHEVQTGSSAPAAAVEFKAEAQAQRLADKRSVLDSLGTGSLQIIDARSEGEHCGKEKLSNRRGGAIPGAANLEWSALVDAETGRFKSPAALKALFDEAGIELDSPVAAHCQSGGRSSVMAFGLELMGATDVRNYYRGWSEWGNADDTPVEAKEE